jgi:arylsulfatase A-like enzyme
VPTLLGKPEQQAKHKHLYWEFHERGFNQAVLMDGRWKAIRLLRTDAPVELYDVANDLGEKQNLAAEKPDLVARAGDLFTASRTESPDWPVKEGIAGGAAKGGKKK